MTVLVKRISMLVFAISGLCVAQDIVYPADAGVVDLTKAPYNADPTGRQDISAAIALATENVRAQGDWAMNIIYLPRGTYLVTNTLKWRFPPYTIGPHMVGQSKTGTVLRLANGTWPLGTEAKAVIQTGEGVAQNFNRGLSNLTVSIGRNNDGAYGVYWYGNNQALMSDVNIISEDGKGLVGLYLGEGEQGPCMARRVKVTGFRRGVTSQALPSVTLSEITLLGQSELGIYNELHPLWIDSLYSNNTVQALYNHTRGNIVLINAVLTGGSSTVPAIKNDAGGKIFLRNITSQGYSQALYSPSTTFLQTPAGSRIEEWTSHGSVSLFQSPAGLSLNLPRKRAPVVAWESDMTKWANVETYKSGRTDAQALQAAIDAAGKTTVYFPKGKHYAIDQDVTVRNGIKRIVGTGGCIGGPGALIISSGSAPVVALEKFASIGSGSGLRIIQRSTRTIVAESILSGPIIVEAAGDVFGTDLVTEGNELNHADAHAWFWQFNGEGQNCLTVRNGTAWVFGWKDEGTGTAGSFLGGKTEILGYLQQCSDINKTGIPLFIVSNSQFCLASLTQTAFPTATYGPYEILIRETSGGQTRELLSSTNVQGSQVPLFTNNPLTRAEDRPVRQASVTSIGSRISLAAAGNVVRCAGVSGVGPWTVELFDAGGRCMFREFGLLAVGGIVQATVPSSQSTASVRLARVTSATGKSVQAVVTSAEQ